MSHKHHGKLAIDYSLPPGCEMLQFPRTDGDASLWPSNQTEEEDEDGNVNFYMPIPEATGTSLKWLHLVGQKVSEEMGLPKDKKYAFTGWPEGYHFFDHHKGAKASPRHDAYLIGCTTVSRFRSVPEFVPHALWLMTDATLDRANCTCKYCSKRKQSAVSQQYGYVSQASRGSATPTASQLPSKRHRRTQQPYAVVQRTKALKAQTEQAQAAKKRKREKAQESQRVAQLEPPENTMHNERVNDLHAATIRLGPERGTRRFHRQGELVWCMLSAPIRAGPPGDGPAITLWPAVIREWATIPEQIAREDYEPPQPGPLDPEELERIQAGRPRIPAWHHYNGENQVPSFDIIHRTRYKAQLLAINAQIMVLDDCVLPYAAWAPPPALLGCLRDVPAHALQHSRDFCPPLSLPEVSSQQEIEAAFARAAAPYSIALEAAAELAASWSVTDEWTAYTVNEGGDEEQETRYQGLWWGPERIWVGDLVQLKMPRKQLHSESLHEPFVPENPPENELGAGDRGVFMHLHCIKSIEVLRPDQSVHDEICISGDLYEVAEDPAYSEPPALQEERDDVRNKILEAAKMAQEKEVDEAAKGVEGLDMSASGSGKGKEREDVTMRPTSDVAPAPAPTTDVTLPNPDPTVPIDQTVPAMLNALGDAPPATNSTRPDGGVLSGPLTAGGDLLPPPPPIFRFRPLIKQAGNEAAVSLDLLGGRYYPGIIQHRMLAEIRQMIWDIARDRPNDALPVECEAVLSLEGVAPGLSCAMSPSRHVQGRKTAIGEAEERAERMLKNNWEDRTGGVNGVHAQPQAGGTWAATPPAVSDEAVKEGLAAMFGDAMDVDLSGFL